MSAKKTEQPILVPIDFSPHSEIALIYASELAEALECPLVALHVVHDPGEAPGYYAAVSGKKKKQLRMIQDVAADMMSQFMHQADKTDARMIVMGSQGRTGLAHVLLGSKAEQVVRLSPRPVTIVKAPRE